MPVPQPSPSPRRGSADGAGARPASRATHTSSRRPRSWVLESADSDQPSPFPAPLQHHHPRRILGMESGEPLPPAAVREAATTCLSSWLCGDKNSRDQLFLLVLAELRSLAQGLLSNERRGHTLQPTALVNEAWVRLIGW